MTRITPGDVVDELGKIHRELRHVNKYTHLASWAQPARNRIEEEARPAMSALYLLAIGRGKLSVEQYRSIPEGRREILEEARKFPPEQVDDVVLSKQVRYYGNRFHTVEGKYARQNELAEAGRILKGIRCINDPAKRYAALLSEIERANPGYRDFIRHEGEMLGLKEGESLLYIGCGAIPDGSFYYAGQFGVNMTAVEKYRESVETARQFASFLPEKHGSLVVTERDGSKVNCGGHDAVVKLFCAGSTMKILRHIYATAEPGTRVAYRNPSGWYRLAFPHLTPKGEETVRKLFDHPGDMLDGVFGTSTLAVKKR